MRKTVLALLFVVGILLPLVSFAAESPYPFSKIIDWKDAVLRENYEVVFTASGIYVSTRELKSTYADQLAEESRCLVLKVYDKTVGHGAVFLNLKQNGVGVRSPEDPLIVFKVHRVDILFEGTDKMIFLATYTAAPQLNWLQKLAQNLAFWRKKYPPAADRKIVSTYMDLGEGYYLDDGSQLLIQRLISVGSSCRGLTK